MRGYDKAHAATPIYDAKHVVVCGGGNVAMDAARMALRLGAEQVDVVYRRTRDEMPARREEIAHAEEEGINFRYLENPVEILGTEDGHVCGIRCLKYQLGEPDASGRRSPVAIEGSEHDVKCDAVIVALGNGSNPLLVATTPGLNADNRGHIVVDEKQTTSHAKVWAGGDIVLGDEHAHAWASALNDIRLVLGSRLDIIDEERADQVHHLTDWSKVENDDDYLAVVYNFVTWVQDSLMVAMLDSMETPQS